MHLSFHRKEINIYVLERKYRVQTAVSQDAGCAHPVIQIQPVSPKPSDCAWVLIPEIKSSRRQRAALLCVHSAEQAVSAE